MFDNKKFLMKIPYDTFYNKKSKTFSITDNFISKISITKKNYWKLKRHGNLTNFFYKTIDKLSINRNKIIDNDRFVFVTENH